MSAHVCVFAGWCTACICGCILKSVYLWVLMHCEHGCTQVHVCGWCGDGVEGRVSQGLLSELAVQRTCLFSLVASDSVSEQLPSQQGPLPSHPPCRHTRTHTLHQLCLNRIMTHTHKHAHTHARHQRPGKADLPLSWITDIHTTPCSQNNLIPLTPSRWVYNQAYVCVRFLSDSV